MKYDLEHNWHNDLSSYNDIYRQLILERNFLIEWFEENKLLNRDRYVADSQKELDRQNKLPFSRRGNFKISINSLLDRLYWHDAVEAMYEFNNIDTGTWTDTEANRLELELKKLQLIITRLENRYDLRYDVKFEYNAKDYTLYLNGIEVFKCGPTTLRHRLLAALFYEPKKQWNNESIEEYFIEHFDFKEGELLDRSINKASGDINTDVAKNTGIREFLIASNSTVKINPRYLS